MRRALDEHVGEIGELSAEGTDLLRRLSEMEGPGKRFVEVRLEEVGNQQANLNERLVIVEMDLAALENTPRSRSSG
jgi:predicted nuclease with TOPRIM domain